MGLVASIVLERRLKARRNSRPPVEIADSLVDLARARPVAR